MYWNNPKIEITYPSTQDPIRDSLHNGKHCLFYDPQVPKNQIHYEQTLQTICNWANSNIKDYGIDGFINNQRNHYDIANIVKLNMWIDDIRKQGIVKPMLLFYNGKEKYGINNGESRLRALERIPSITHLSSFISTSIEYADKFNHLEKITSFEQFAQRCQAINGQNFLFTLTDPLAPYGLYWYEYDSRRTAPVMPSETYCVDALHNYLKNNSQQFTPEWFDNLTNWSGYTELRL